VRRTPSLWLTGAKRPTRQPVNVAAAGEYVAGTYRQRFTLASGRFAVIDDGLGFQLVPWSPSLETTAGSSGTSGENAVWDYSANSVVSGFRGVIAIRR